MDVIHEFDQFDSLEWLSTHPSHKTRHAKIEEQLPDAISFRKYCKVRKNILQTVDCQLIYLKCCLNSVRIFLLEILAKKLNLFVGLFLIPELLNHPSEFS